MSKQNWLIYLFFYFFLGIIPNLHAQEEDPFSWGEDVVAQAFLSSTDSVFLAVGEYKDKFIYHTLTEKQTLYSLARFYGLGIQDLYDYNPSISKDQIISVGQKVRIPIPNRAILRYPTTNFDPSQYAKLYYKVRPRETLFKIAKRNFKMPVDTIKARNRLTSNTIHTNQILHLGWININGIPDSLQGLYVSPQAKRNIYLKDQFSYKKGKLHVERGAGAWQKNGSLNKGMYVLHRKARRGDVIAITNLMNKRTIYAKVLTKFPLGAYSSEVVVVMSSEVATLLGAKDSRFFVEVRYKK